MAVDFRPISQNFGIQNGPRDVYGPKDASSELYYLEGERRPGRYRYHPIVIPIVRLPDLSLIEESLPEIFRLINKHTINVPYPLQDTAIELGGTVVFRPNHNGTHAARQARYVQEIFDLVQYRGTRNAREQMNSLSEEERLNLLLASFLLRSGRVDESSHKSAYPDPYPRRSAMIYQEYARQLGVSEPVIEWTSRLIKNACLPKGVRDPQLETDPKAMFGYQVLTLAHELDLIRCFPKDKFDETTKDLILHQLNYFVSGRFDNSKDLISEQLLDFSKTAIEVTGFHRQYDDFPLNTLRFARCSTECDFCWEQLQSIPLPIWIR